ncbi:MAG TPA: GGDEF domain-containing protein [Levilactobacillus hammesii]|uniref:GGDEF domain-containing protein n=1 Tax=Levilactobacillus hammesii TaxID=267633 RepID=A0A921F0D4_9LACO|nr:GGDEF domain-containing protein [Levilactobacillus hammesii]
MTWSVWLVPPMITSIFFVLGVITLYWSIFNWATSKAESQNKPVNVKRVQTIVGLVCAVTSVFALQLIVRDSHLSWTFTNFQLLLLIFVAYFLQVRIPYWAVFLAGIAFMLMNGNIDQPLSWVYTFLFVFFYVFSYVQSTHLWRAPFTRYAIVAVVFALPLWYLVKLRFHLPWSTYFDEMINYLILVVLMYGYFKIQDKDRRIKDRLFQSANWDALTKVQNFAAYDRAIGYEFRQSAAHDRDLSMIMFDIDHFKHVNDTYGHLAGDEVLKQVSRTVASTLKAVDPKIVLYRTGGEEFNIIFPNYTVDRTEQVAQKVFDAVKDLTIAYNDVEIKVTISVGVSALSLKDSNPLDFYKRVDANLYRSKQNGRQQITVG